MDLDFAPVEDQSGTRSSAWDGGGFRRYIETNVRRGSYGHVIYINFMSIHLRPTNLYSYVLRHVR